MHTARGQRIIVMTVIAGVQYPSISTTIPFIIRRTTHTYADVTASYQPLPSHDMQNTIMSLILSNVDYILITNLMH